MCKKHNVKKWIVLVFLVFMMMPLIIKSSDVSSVSTLQKLCARSIYEQVSIIKSDIFRQVSDDNLEKLVIAFDRYNAYKDDVIVVSHPDIKIPSLHNSKGQTPMHVAKTLPIMKYLKIQGLDIDDRGNFGATPLDTQIRNVIEGRLDIDVINNLINQGADMKKVGIMHEVNNAIFNQAAQGNVARLMSSFQIYRYYHESLELDNVSGVQPFRLVNSSGQTPFHVATSKDVIDFLKKSGFCINHQDLFGNTPLHNQMQRVIDDSLDMNVIYTLVKAGANINAVNHTGQNILHMRLQNLYDDFDRYSYYLRYLRGSHDRNLFEKINQQQRAQAIFLASLGVNIYQYDTVMKTPLDCLDNNIALIDDLIAEEPIINVFSDRYNRTRQLKQKLIFVYQLHQMKLRFFSSLGYR